jgi:hypothetical protein
MAFDLSPSEFKLADLLQACLDGELHVKAEMIKGCVITKIHKAQILELEGELVLANDDPFEESLYYTFQKGAGEAMIKNTGKSTFHEIFLLDDQSDMEPTRFGLSFYRITYDYIC